MSNFVGLLYYNLQFPISNAFLKRKTQVSRVIQGTMALYYMCSSVLRIHFGFGFWIQEKFFGAVIV